MPPHRERPLRWQESGMDGRVWCRMDTFYYETSRGEAWSIELWEYAVGGGDAPFVAFAYDADSGEPGPEADGITGEEALDALIDVIEDGEGALKEKGPRPAPERQSEGKGRGKGKSKGKKARGARRGDAREGDGKGDGDDAGDDLGVPR